MPRGARLLTTEHGIAGDSRLYHRTARSFRFKQQLHRLRMRRTCGVIAVSQATAAEVSHRWGAPAPMGIQVVRNGRNPEAPPAAPAAGSRFGFVGRFEPEKGLDSLLDAFALVRQELPDASLALFGHGSLSGRLQGRVNDEGLESSVRFAGPTAAADALKQVDVVVQLSRWENCSYSLLDALATRKGVVATDVGGNPEMLPRHALVPVDDARAAAGSMVAQALEPANRPSLPPDWPTVTDMTAQLGQIYSAAAKARA
jgi:glycosyltransferase involved in cell wall biosynthesis